MPTPEMLLLFLGAAVLLTLAPGPDILMVVSLGMARGRRAGIAFGVGCGMGCLSHTLLAALGVSAAIAASPTAFLVLRIAGALYLIWLGFSALKSTLVRAKAAEGEKGLDLSAAPGSFQTAGVRQLFVRGLIANGINPKVILFFLALLPQFVVAGQGSPTVQMLVFGVVFTLQAAALFAVIGALSGSLGQRLARDPRVARWLDRVAGVVFIGLGVALGGYSSEG